MARRPMVQVTCDRCKKTYDAPPSPSTNAQEDLLSLASGTGIFIDASDLQLGQITYEDLCPRCKKRVTSLISDIKRFQDNDEGESEPAPDVRNESTHRPQTGDGLTPEMEERQ